MTCSPARLEANRRNALRSTGPKTPEGKARSRANALKHGLTGDGTVLPPEDMAEVEALASQLEREMKPSGAMGRLLLRRVAAMSTRLDRCARLEAVMTAKRVRDAAQDRDNARHAEAEAIGSGLAASPHDAVRRLMQTPEGIDWLIRAWMAVRGELVPSRKYEWDYRHLKRVDHLLGRERGEQPPTPFEPLCRSLCGDSSGLPAEQKEGLTRAGRKAWVREQLKALIDGEVEALRELRADVDGEDEAIDRAEACERALFDPSKEGQLARKYEAAADRSLFQALREFRRVEERAGSEAVAAPSSTAVPPAGPGPRPRVASARSAPARHPAPVAAQTNPTTPAQTNPTTPAQTNPTMPAWVPAIGGPW